LTAVLDRAEARPPDGLIWVGHVEGVTGSQVGWVVEGELCPRQIEGLGDPRF
jgi:hypothetical protein